MNKTQAAIITSAHTDRLGGTLILRLISPKNLHVINGLILKLFVINREWEDSYSQYAMANMKGEVTP